MTKLIALAKQALLAVVVILVIYLHELSQWLDEIHRRK